MATDVEKAGLKWKGQAYIFKHKMDKGHETYTFEGYNGEIIDEISVDHPRWRDKSFEDWARQKIKIVMESM